MHALFCCDCLFCPISIQYQNWRWQKNCRNMFLKSIVHFINSFHICFYPDLLAIESQKEEKPAGQVTKIRTRPSLLSSRSGTAIVNPPPPLFVWNDVPIYLLWRSTSSCFDLWKISAIKNRCGSVDTQQNSRYTGMFCLQFWMKVIIRLFCSFKTTQLF